jgi:hypothetical protein
MVVQKSSWWAKRTPLPIKPMQRSLERLKQKLLGWLNLPEKPTKRLRKHIATDKMTQRHWGMKLRMMLPPEGHHPKFNQ